MIEIPRAGLAVSKEFPLALHLRKELLWQQEKPISSAVEWLDKSTPQHFLFLLSEGLFVRLRRENGAWIPADSTELPPGRQSRLGRGSFIHGYPGEQIGILLDGKECGLEIGNPRLIYLQTRQHRGKSHDRFVGVRGYRRNSHYRQWRSHADGSSHNGWP